MRIGLPLLRGGCGGLPGLAETLLPEVLVEVEVALGGVLFRPLLGVAIGGGFFFTSGPGKLRVLVLLFLISSGLS